MHILFLNGFSNSQHFFNLCDFVLVQAFKVIFRHLPRVRGHSPNNASNILLNLLY